MLPAPGTLIGGRYRLERKLAEGGMGAVWVGRHLELDVLVAVKLLTDTQSESRELSHARFRREAKAAAQLKSPHVTLIHDFGVEDGSPYIVMELLEGEDLAMLLGREGKLSVERAAHILDQVSQGLAAAHDVGIIHRDLKPSNVFLARIGRQEVAKILDFGIAKELGTRLVDSDRTKSGVVIGSPRYMSPEQTQGGPLDTRSDLWSLGVMAYEMVTGETPFDGEYMWHVIAAICTKPPPRVSERVPGLSRELDRFFDRALARELSERFSSAAELSEAFTAVASGRALPTPVRMAQTGPAAAFEPTVLANADSGNASDGSWRSPAPPAGETTRVASVTQPSPGAQRPGDNTTARTMEVDARAPQRVWRRRLVSVVPIAIGVAIAAVGWMSGRGSSETSAAAEPVESTAPAEVSAEVPERVEPVEAAPSASVAPSASHAPVASPPVVPRGQPRPKGAPQLAPSVSSPAPVPAPRKDNPFGI
jgi:serine/threonine-protein kinase